MLKFQRLKATFKVEKVKLRNFIKSFIQYFEHVECIAIDIFDVFSN